MLPRVEGCACVEDDPNQRLVADLIKHQQNRTLVTIIYIYIYIYILHRTHSIYIYMYIYLSLSLERFETEKLAWQAFFCSYAPHGPH